MDITNKIKDIFNQETSGKLNGIEGAKLTNDFMRAMSSTEMNESEFCDSCEKPKSECDCDNSETKESTGSGSAGGYSAPLFTESDGEITKVETKEATGSSSVGTYDAPGFEDVNMKGNHKRGSGKSYKKTQIPGGKFVEVKAKCKKFPYCNQGDIKSLKIFENEKLQEAIKNVSKKMNISESVIKNIITYEYENRKSK
jgi:hypothetical protein